MKTNDNFISFLEKSNIIIQNSKLLSEKCLPLINTTSGKAMLEKKDFSSFKPIDIFNTIKSIMSAIKSNQEYINEEHIYIPDLNQSILTIFTALNSYLKSLNSVSPSNNNGQFVSKLLIDIVNFTNSIITFSTILCEIINSISEINKLKDPISTRILQNLHLRLGIECSLFNFSVRVETTNDYPFFKSNFIQIYNCRNKIDSIIQKIVPIKSFCGTGKTTLIPLILFCQNLKDSNSIDKNVPFILMILPDQSHVDSKTKLFNKLISKYVDIESDEQKLLNIFNSYEKVGKGQKLTLGLLTPYNFPRLMHNIKDRKEFFRHTRFIIDEINQRSFHLTVIMSRFFDFDFQNSYELSMNVVFLSSAFPKVFKTELKESTKIVSLIKNPQFNIEVEAFLFPATFKDSKCKDSICNDSKDKDSGFFNNLNCNINKIYPKLQKKIKSVLNKMIEDGSDIEEGHVLCFLPNTHLCNQLKNSIITEINDDFFDEEKMNKKKKIIMLQTSLEPNESFESFSKRLLKEYDSIEKSRIDENNNDVIFVYFLPLVICGLSESTIYSLIQNEFPNIKKMIFSTPILESYHINNLSVVIDSGLFREKEFSNKTCLDIFYEKQASQESMFLRYGRLGRSMNGLYIFFFPEGKKRFESQVPSIKIRDLTTNLLLMKQVQINFEEMKNLLDEPNKYNLNFSIRALKQIKAINEENKITIFGDELLRFEFIPIWYMAAVLRYSQTFSDENDKKFAYFITAYISTVIAMDKLLIREEMTELMSSFYDEDSDLVTLFNALNSLLIYEEINNNDEFRNLVESYGFSYSKLLKLNDDLQRIVDFLFPGHKVNEIINVINNFIKKNRDIYHIIDEFIEKIEYPNWKQIHMIRFNDVRNTESHKTPEIVFLADSKLAFFHNQPSGKVFLRKRPGWKGINVPTNCYCFNIQFIIERNDNQVFRKYIGHLIHRQRQNRIKTIEIKSTIAMNPWFDVLLKTYLKDEDIGLVNNYKFGGNIFHYSNIGDSTFLSYISNRDDAEQKITKAIKVCLTLINFTPKSVLIYNSKLESITEIYSIGSDRYDSLDGTYLCGCPFDRIQMEHCMSHKDEIRKSRSKIRIASLFVNETCELEDFDKTTLYLINMQDKYYTSLLPHIKERYNEMIEEKRQRNRFLNDSNKTDYFQFSQRFIHPSLFYHKQSKKCIKKWLSNYCNDIIEGYQIVKHKIKMKCSQIYQLQKRIEENPDEVKQQMKLNYVAIPFPRNIYEKNKIEISQHPTWSYKSTFNVIIVAKDEVENVISFINEKRLDKEMNSFFTEKSLDSSLCINICEDQRNPELINSPISILLENGESISTKLCRNCIFERLCYVTESYYSIKYIDAPPYYLYPIHSEECIDGSERWPQIPFGQLVTVLIKNDDQLSSLISTYLSSINDYAIHHKMKYHFTYCPNHRQPIINVKNAHGIIRCREKNCMNIYCNDCHTMHPVSKCNFHLFKDFKNLKVCPACSNVISKDEGCNYMKCICGIFFCYICLEISDTDTEATDHFERVHKGSFYSINGDKDKDVCS